MNTQNTSNHPYNFNHCPWRARFKRMLVLSIVTIAAISIFGLPYVRWNYRYVKAGSHKHVTEAVYWNGIDKFHATPYSLGHDCHPVVLVPVMERLPAMKQTIEPVYQSLKHKIYGLFQ